MKPVVIFGNGEMAEVVAFYFENDLGRTVSFFVVDDAFATESAFYGRPLLSWSEVHKHASSTDHEVFVAIGYAKMNETRARICHMIEDAGFSLTSLVSSRAIVPANFQIGKNSMILENNTVQPFSTIGHNTFLWSGNHVGHHVRIGSNAFISSHCVISGGVSIGDNSFLGVNSTVGDHVTIGEKVIVGAGAIVLNDLPRGSVVVANQSRIASLKSDQIPDF